MAIKQQHTLSKEDFEAALVTLRLSVSEVARDTEIPRHVVSHFRNYGDGMKPEQVAKLRDYLEDKGIEFTEEEAAEELAATAPTEPQTSDSAQITLPVIVADDGLTQRTALVCRHFFVDERITDEQISEAGERIHESFTQAKELLGVELVDAAFGGYTEATETKMRELWGHLARIGLVSLHMQGRVLIDQSRILTAAMPDDDRPAPKNLGDLLALTYREVITDLNDAAQTAEEPQEEEATA